MLGDPKTAAPTGAGWRFIDPNTAVRHDQEGHKTIAIKRNGQWLEFLLEPAVARDFAWEIIDGEAD